MFQLSEFLDFFEIRVVNCDAQAVKIAILHNLGLPGVGLHYHHACLRQDKLYGQSHFVYLFRKQLITSA